MNKKFRIVLAGNPNCGKTCIFNALTSARQHVGNYPGVTVESKSGSFTLNDMEIELIDLPGVYSLSSSSPEEASERWRQKRFLWLKWVFFIPKVKLMKNLKDCGRNW